MKKNGISRKGLFLRKINISLIVYLYLNELEQTWLYIYM